MPLLLKPSYVKVLLALRDGKPRNHDEICVEAGLEGLECTGAISILRRDEDLEQAGDRRFRITEKGRMMLDTAPRIEVSRRPS